MTSRLVEYQDGSDDNVAPQPQQRWGKVAVAVGAACALLVVGFATGSHFWSSQAFSKEVAPLQLSQIAVTPPRQECAKTGVNCIAQKCCKVSGYECYEVHAGYAKCMKECVQGKDGTCLHHTVPMVPSKRSDISYSANTLFCWSFYTADTGSTKKSYELDLLRTQLKFGAGMFGCNRWDVFSDVNEQLSPGPPVPLYTNMVVDPYNEFHQSKRPETGNCGRVFFFEHRIIIGTLSLFPPCADFDG